MDDIDAVIELSKELLKSARKELEIESRPQLRFSVNTENPFLLEKFSKVIDDMDVGDFIYLDLDDSGQSNWRSRKPVKVKQRIIGYTIEIVDLSDTSCEFEFSDMVHCYGNATDDEYLLGTGNYSQKNSKYISRVATKALTSYLSGGNSVFLGDLSSEDRQKLIDALDGLVNGKLSVDELSAKVAEIETLKADCAFIKYLNAQYLVANQAEFGSLKADVATINTILGGTGSFENGQFIYLTTSNLVVESEAAKKIIAGQISVGDLQAGTLKLGNGMIITSPTGNLVMNGEALQITGKDSKGKDYVAIQLGYDTQNNPSLIICNETGAVMLDAQGLHEDIVPDGLIKNDMIADSTIGREKFSFNVVEADKDGAIYVAEVYVKSTGTEVEYVKIGDTLSGVSQKVDAVEGKITQEVWKQSKIPVKDENGNIVLDENGNPKTQTLEYTIVQNTTDINGVKNIIKSFTTELDKEGEEISFLERTNHLIRTSQNFQSTVKETYLQTSDVGARNLLRNSKTLIHKDYELYKLS